MRGRWLLAKWGLLLGSGAGFAQPPAFPRAPSLPQPPLYPQSRPQQPAQPQIPPGPLAPALPQAPSSLPGGLTSPGGSALGSPRTTNGGDSASSRNPIAMPQEVPLPQRENRFPIDSGNVRLKRVGGGWQLWADQRMLRDFGDHEADARDVARVFRDIRPTEWATIGSPRPVVEYGLVNGRPPMTADLPSHSADESRNVFQGGGGSGPAVSGAGAKAILPIDLKTVRVEAVRGVWCVRDDTHLFFNFGPNKADAEQAHAVILRYGFNRVGVVGTQMPVMHYLFASADSAAPKATPLAKLELQGQIEGLTRVGIPVGGVGYVGEMFRFDPRKLEVRKEGGDWIIASGTDAIGRYGPSEYAARDALRTIQQARFNEFCQVGSGDLTFFLVDGKAPIRPPYHTQVRQFDPSTLKVRKLGDKWSIAENSRHLLDCASADEGETLIRLLKHYQFDTLCHLGPSPKLGVTFLAKGR